MELRLPTLLPLTPLDLNTLARAIWTDLTRALSSSLTLCADGIQGTDIRSRRSRWLGGLPNGTPLLLLGTPADFSDSGSTGQVGCILLLDTSKGRAALAWSNGIRWRDFRPMARITQPALPQAQHHGRIRI